MAVASASSNLLQLPLPKNPSFSSVATPSSLSIPSRRHRCLPICCSSSSSLSAAAHPALRHAEVLFFKSGYNVQIVVDEDEPEEVLIRRFRREVSKAGVIQECRRRRYFENKQEAKKRKAREAGRRNRWRRLGYKFTPPPSSADGDAPKNVRDDEDDNWDLPEGDLPY